MQIVQYQISGILEKPDNQYLIFLKVIWYKPDTDTDTDTNTDSDINKILQQP